MTRVYWPHTRRRPTFRLRWALWRDRHARRLVFAFDALILALTGFWIVVWAIFMEGTR